MFGCRPIKWLWGLIPLAIVIAAAIFGVGPQIERDLEQRTSAALKEAGLAWARPQFSARDGVLEGYTFSREARDKALKAVSQVWGVRTVSDQAKLVTSVEPYQWWAVRKENKIKLRGHVPTSSDRQTILGFVKASMPEMTVDDGMELAGGTPERQAWLGAVSFALTQLGRLKHGTARLEGMKFSMSGEAASTAAYRAVKTALTSQIPEGMTLKANDVMPPVMKPYEFKVKYQGSVVKFSGFVPREAARSQILEKAKNLFPDTTITDKLELASGAPEGWLWAITTSLTHLHRLETGRVEITDNAVAIEGSARDKATAEDIAQSIRHGLPADYTSTDKIAFPGKSESGQTPDDPSNRDSGRTRYHNLYDASPKAYAVSPGGAGELSVARGQERGAIPF